MKKVIILLFILLFELPAIYSQTIVGGSGTCITNGNPNTVASLYVIDSKSSCTIVKDTVSGKLYSYVSSNPNGYKWVLIPTITQDSTSNWLVGGNQVNTHQTIGTLSNYDFIFRTNNTERMRILANGNVGIGTASPATKFHIVGAETHGGTGGDTYTMWQVNGANTYLQGSDAAIFGGTATDFGNYLYGNNKWYVATNGSKRLVIDGSGNVGIGTATPITKLDILSGEIRVNGIYIGHGYGSNTTQNLRIGDAQAANSTGLNNTAVGILAMRSNTTGYSNTAYGTDALGSNTIGVFNVAMGVSALSSTLDGSHNMGIGTNCMSYNVSGNYNIGIGTNSLLHNLANSNIGIGYGAGESITTGSNNIMIGKDIDATSATASNEINIGGAIKVINNILHLPVYDSGAETDSILTMNNARQIFRRKLSDILRFSTGAVNGYIAKTDALGNLSWTDPSVITGWSVNGATAYNQNSKIGIGTLIPTYKLDVDSRAYGTEPLRLKGLLQGNLTDSILSSANGVVKRLSIAEVNNIVGENIISVNATISAGSDLSGGSTPFTTTMSGVSIGDYVDVMAVPDDNNVTDINVKAWVSATNTVSYQIENKRATTVVFTNKDLKIRVRK